MRIYYFLGYLLTKSKGTRSIEFWHLSMFTSPNKKDISYFSS